MKVAIFGSRSILALLSRYIPAETTEILIGGSRGVDACARSYAETHGIPYRMFPLDHGKDVRKAVFGRCDSMVATADFVLAFWDGRSRTVKYVIGKCRELDKPIKIYGRPASSADNGGVSRRLNK